jgi:hypothetical protein
LAKIDELVKSPKFRHAPAFARAGSAKLVPDSDQGAGIQNYLKTLDSRLRGNDVKGHFKTFYESIKIALCDFRIDRGLLKRMISFFENSD